MTLEQIALKEAVRVKKPFTEVMRQLAYLESLHGRKKLMENYERYRATAGICYDGRQEK